MVNLKFIAIGVIGGVDDDRLGLFVDGGGDGIKIQQPNNQPYNLTTSSYLKISSDCGPLLLAKLSRTSYTIPSKKVQLESSCKRATLYSLRGSSLTCLAFAFGWRSRTFS